MGVVWCGRGKMGIVHWKDMCPSPLLSGRGEWVVEEYIVSVFMDSISGGCDLNSERGVVKCDGHGFTDERGVVRGL